MKLGIPKPIDVFRMDICPLCQSTKTTGVSSPLPSLSGEYDVEQLCACVDCKKEFVTVYLFAKNIPVSDSSRYSTPGEPKSWS